VNWLSQLSVAIPLAGPISDWAGVPQLADYLWLLPVALLGGGVYQCLSYWAIRRQDFRRLARTRLAQASGQVGSQVIIGALVVRAQAESRLSHPTPGPREIQP